MRSTTALTGVFCVLTSHALFYIHLQRITLRDLEKTFVFSNQHGSDFLSLFVLGPFFTVLGRPSGNITQLELWLPEVLTISWVKYGPKNKKGSNK